MSKEYLEAFKIVYNNFDYLISDVGIENDDVNICLKTIKEQLPTIKQALQHLEAIDNANPSEALKCLEKVYSRLPQWDLSRNVDQCNIIKQALLKAQESKKYLTWEDLDFKEEEQIMKVLLNGEEYKLSYFTDGITEYVDLLAGNGKYQMGRYVDCYPTDVKFFNDLHLEEILKEDKSE